MDALQFEIVRFLVTKAIKKSRVTYQQLGSAIGWKHPTGRGLGKNLEVILRYLQNEGLPPLTTILVKKGEKYPAPDAMAYISRVLGQVDIQAAQTSVFNFNWTSISQFAEARDSIPGARDIWLTSFWGFEPSNWGCIGFSDEPKRTGFLRRTRPGTLVAIYVTKGRGAQDMRGKVVGLLETSHRIGNIKEFISGDRWAEKEREQTSKGKWSYAVEVTRAWKVIPEQWKPVEELLPTAYSSAHAEFIGGYGVPINKVEAKRLLSLEVVEVPVYRQHRQVADTIQPLGTALSPSPAVRPSQAPYLVSEQDGPKYLYILELKGDIAAYLGRSLDEVEGKSIIKVGFSKSPLTRRDQIQSAYPHGQFKWSVLFPKTIPERPPFSNAEVAIAGEDAMKHRLVTGGAELLGGEFFLAEEALIYNTWTAGTFASNAANLQRSTNNESIGKGNDG